MSQKTDSVTKWVYAFDEKTDNMNSLLGGKGAGLAEMTHIGLPVPPGFTIITKACKEFIDNNNQIPVIDIFTNRSHANYIYKLLVDGTKNLDF